VFCRLGLSRCAKVCSPRYPPLPPREPLERELAATGAGTVITINPDQTALDAFGTNMGDWAAWQPARQAGIRQASTTAEQVRAAWHRHAG
jgi:NTE family protein